MTAANTSSGSVRVDRKSWRLLAGMIVVAILIYVSTNIWTAPMGWAWHLFRGNSVSFSGYRINVPRDMWARRSGSESVTILRQAPKYNLSHALSGTLVFTRSPGPATDMSRNYDKIAQANEQLTLGLHPKGIRKIAGAKGTVYCWESANSDVSELYISCWFDKDTLAASYAGTPNYRDDFYRAVSVLAGTE